MTTKKKYNLVGGGFNNYDGENKASSIHKQESQYIEWVDQGAEDTFYVDEHIGLVFDDQDSVKKYGWLLESAQIKPQVIEDIKSEVEFNDLMIDSEIAKVSIVGVGMRSQAGVASKAFKALSENDVNIQIICTSEIKITMVIDKDLVDKAVQVLHEEFELDK